jgi:Fe-S-cluster containining protein
METTSLSLNDKLPLTCSRTGICCHGKRVQLNPWELVCLAYAKQMTVRDFRDTYCDYGGVRLRFNGASGWKAQQACSQYIEGFGCSVHTGRPLSCRLYPLGRQIQSNQVHYMFEGKEFPCLDGCREVLHLQQLTVEEYLEGQQVSLFEKAQDEYLELMQNLADIAFMLLLDTNLATSGDRETLQQWRKMGNMLPEVLVQQIPVEWMDCLMLPDIAQTDDPVLFAKKHSEILQQKAQDEFAHLQTLTELRQASILVMALALQMARSIGADPKTMAEYWVDIAKNNGALE